MKILIELVPADGDWQKAETIIERIREATEGGDEVTVDVKGVNHIGGQVQQTKGSRNMILDDEMRDEIRKIVREEIEQSERRIAAAICSPKPWEMIPVGFQGKGTAKRASTTCLGDVSSASR